MAEDKRTNDDAADAGLGSRSGARIEGEQTAEGSESEASGAEVRGGDPAAAGEGGQPRGDGDESAGRRGDWDPGIIRGGGELY